MARARNIKPSFFKNEHLADLPMESRLLFIGLWNLADRKGRLEDRPKRIKGELFPYDNIDVDSCLDMLENSEGKFIVRYEANGKRYIQVVNFEKHQNPHKNEAASAIPEPCISVHKREEHDTSMVQLSEEHASDRADSLNLIPDSLSSDSLSSDSLREEEDACVRAREEPAEDEYGNPLPDPEWQKVSDCYLSQIGMLPSGTHLDSLSSYTDDMGSDVVCLAITETNRKQPSNPKYFLLKILENWFEAGIRDAETAKAYLLDRERKQMPATASRSPPAKEPEQPRVLKIVTYDDGSYDEVWA